MPREKGSYYGVLPADVRYDKELSSSAKIIYAEITSLCRAKGYCWASNNYFRQLFDVSKQSIITWLSKLEKKNYIKITRTNGKQRKIYIVERGVKENISKDLMEQNYSEEDSANENIISENTYVKQSKINEISGLDLLYINEVTNFNLNNLNPNILSKNISPSSIEDHVYIWNYMAATVKKSGGRVPMVEIVNEGRKRKLNKRIKETGFDFKLIMNKVLQSDFLMGKKEDVSNNFFSFDWVIVNDTNYVKILEGKYCNRL